MALLERQITYYWLRCDGCGLTGERQGVASEAYFVAASEGWYVNERTGKALCPECDDKQLAELELQSAGAAPDVLFD